MVDNLEKEFEVKSRLLNELQQILDAKIKVISQLQKKLDASTESNTNLSTELSQQKLELDSMRNLLSYKIGKSYGDKFGDAPGSKLFEKMISYFFKQNYDDLSNSKEIQSQKILESKEPHAEIISESTDTSESTELSPEENLYEYLKPKLTPTQKNELIMSRRRHEKRVLGQQESLAIVASRCVVEQRQHVDGFDPTTGNLNRRSAS